MTKKQRDVLKIIFDFWQKKGYGPSIRDVMRARSSHSAGGTYQVIGRLKDAGWLVDHKKGGQKASAHSIMVSESGRKMLEETGK